MLIAGLALVLSLVAFAACKNDSSKNAASTTEAAVPGTKYICPMNCEKGKTYDQPGSCPVCHMDLEPSKAEVEANKAEYFTAFAATPAQLEAGKSGMLSFTPKIKGNEAGGVPLDVQHEKKIHLIAVSDDLSWFNHIHPEYQPDGSYVVKSSFPNGGKYTLFADYKPTGADHQLEKISLEVAGKPTPPKIWSAAKTSMTTTGGYMVSLESKTGKFVEKGETHIMVKMKKGGKEIMASQLENYLGAKGHAVVISADGEKRYLHLHPGTENDRLHLSASFGKPGVYRGWLQFQHEGKIHTADFVLNVESGMGETLKDNHGHEGHTH